MSRYQTTTQKVKTPFASVFVHVEFDDAGRARSFRISAPQKLESSTVGDLLDRIGETATAMLRDSL